MGSMELREAVWAAQSSGRQHRVPGCYRHHRAKGGNMGSTGPKGSSMGPMEATQGPDMMACAPLDGAGLNP